MNLWHYYLMETYRAAVTIYERARDVETIGYAADEALYSQSHPHPRLRDFMVRLSGEWSDRGAVA